MSTIAEQTGIEPEALQTCPVIPEIYKEFCSAFMILSSRRTAGMGANPIQLSEIKAYIELYGVPAFGISMFVEMMVKMDTEFLLLTAKR